MALNSPAWLLSNAFTKATADEFGAVKGAPCTVGTVSFDADGNTVVELVWTNTSGASRTTPVTIKKGLGIKSVTVDADEHLILTMTDNTTIDAGEIPKPDLSDYAKKIDIPTKVEDLDDAADYAKKSEIPEGSVVDDDLSETSKNPVQNKTVTAELKKKVDAEVGKGLSTNDYDNDAVAEVAKIKDKVDVETGKSLVSDTDIAQITTNKNAIDILNGDDTTEGSVSKQLKDALGDITEFDIKVVATLPATGEKGIFYFVPKEGGTDPDVHDEYVWVGTKFELIGNTKVDLSDYIAKTDIATEFGNTPSDNKIPSEKLVKDGLDAKADSTIVTGYTNLDVGADFNTLIEYGTYRTTTKRIDRIDNVPIRVAGMLEVRLTGGVIYQTYKTIDDEMYIRSSEDTGATWADWKKLSTGADGLEIVRKTKAEYDALSEDEKNDPTKLYDVYDEESLNLTDYAKKTELKDSFYAETKVADCNNAPIGMSYAEPTSANKPISDAHYFFLNTIKWKADENWQTQIAYDIHNGKEYHRQKSGSAWSSWHEIVTSEVQTATVKNEDHGIDAYFYKQGKMVMLRLYGQTKRELDTNGKSEKICDVPNGFEPSVGSVFYHNSSRYLFQILPSTTAISLGFSRDVADPSNGINYPKGSFISNQVVYFTN